jgi:hypothetical protein
MLLIPFSSITPDAVLQLPEALDVFPTVIVPVTTTVSGVLVLDRPQIAWWIAVPELAVTVAPPAPPVVPPFWLAKPLALVAADAVVVITFDAPTRATAIDVVKTARNRKREVLPR